MPPPEGLHRGEASILHSLECHPLRVDFPSKLFFGWMVLTKWLIRVQSNAVANKGLDLLTGLNVPTLLVRKVSDVPPP
jgi:hypothetical protein